MILFLVSVCFIALNSYFIVNKVGPANGLENVISLVILSFAQIILVTQVISILGSLNAPAFLMVQTGLLAGIVPICYKKIETAKWQIDFSLFFKDRLIFLTLVVIIVVLLVDIVLIVYVPPNTFDSMTYHLSRIGFWMQHQSLEHFYTTDTRQTCFAFNSEILMMHARSRSLTKDLLMEEGNSPKKTKVFSIPRAK